VGFLERDFERDHLAEKNNRTKMGQKIHCAMGKSKYTEIDLAAYYTDDILLFHVTSQIVSFSPHRFAVMPSQLTRHLAPSGAALYISYKTSVLT
jgi:hypothetical protein